MTKSRSPILTSEPSVEMNALQRAADLRADFDEA